MNELAKKAENGISLDGMLSQAELYVKSGFFPKHIDTKEKAVVIMLKGRELGLPFTEALGKISVIQGIATTKVETMLALARRTGQMEDFKLKHFPNEINPQYAECMIKRKGQSPYTCRFGDEEAKAMGLDGRDNYKKQKGTMYGWRAISKNLRFTFPDAIGGLYLEEEIADDVIVSQSADPQVTEIVNAIPESQQPQANDSETVKTEDIPDDQIGNFVMPFGKYKGMRLTQIVGEVTAEGKNKGLEYLNWIVGQEARTEGAKATHDAINRFLTMFIKD